MSGTAVGAVTEGLLGGAAALAPVILLTHLEFSSSGLDIIDNGVGHWSVLVCAIRRPSQKLCLAPFTSKGAISPV